MRRSLNLATSLVAIAWVTLGAAGCSGSSNSPVDAELAQDAGSDAGGSLCATNPEYDDDVLLNTPADIDKYRGCVTITGDVEIRGSTLVNVDGLESVTSIYGALIIRENAELIDLSGFANVFALGRVDIVDNAKLVSLDGLGMVSRMRRLYVHNNAVLESLSGLENVASLGFPFADPSEITSNPALTDLDGLSGLERVGGDLRIGRFGLGNDALVNTEGLSNLQEISGTLEISGNAQLTAITLAGIQSIGGDFVVDENPSLTTLGASAAFTVLAGAYRITDNAQLPTCLAEALLEQLQAAGYDGPTLVSRNDDDAECD